MPSRSVSAEHQTKRPIGEGQQPRKVARRSGEETPSIMTGVTTEYGPESRIEAPMLSAVVGSRSIVQSLGVTRNKRAAFTRTLHQAARFGRLSFLGPLFFSRNKTNTCLAVNTTRESRSASKSYNFCEGRRPSQKRRLAFFFSIPYVRRYSRRLKPEMLVAPRCGRAPTNCSVTIYYDQQRQASHVHQMSTSQAPPHGAIIPTNRTTVAASF